MKKNESDGFFVVVDGINGAGKSTLVESLKAALESLGKRVVVSKEPSSMLRSTILSSDSKILDDEVMMIDFYIEDRRGNIENVILPALSSGAVVILDRYFFSTVAYQTYSSRRARKVLKANDFVLQPDVAITLDLDEKQALSRIDERLLTRFSSLHEASLRTCYAREIYQSLSKMCKWCEILDASREPQEVFEDAFDIILSRLTRHDYKRLAKANKSSLYRRHEE